MQVKYILNKKNKKIIKAKILLKRKLKNNYKTT